MEKRDALLEIRIENIPARFITSAEEQLVKYAIELLASLDLKAEDIRAYGTYKRLVLYVKGLPPKTGEKTEKIYGPSASVWKNPDGSFTPQSAGFAGKHGASPDKLMIDPAVKGGTLYLEKKTAAKASLKVLAEIFPLIISKLSFPKNMVWETSKFRFARPIRSITALYGDRPVNFLIAGVKSSRKTVGLSARGSKELTIRSAEKYFTVLENANVLVDDDKRRKTLLSEIEAASKRMKLEAEKDEELIKENLYLVEYPVCVAGGFSQEFLSLPAELVHLVMKKQLKFFSFADSAGKLQPYFLGVRDGVSRGQRNVEEGFKNVLEARFKDAVFFYKKDLQTPLDEMAGKLKRIMFHEKLGNMIDKTARVAKIALWLVENSGLKCSGEAVEKSASLVYADLSSELVREFTELQGIMGYYYAVNSNLAENNARVLREFYLPVSAKSEIPSTHESSIVSLAGKIDTLAGDFAVGIVPTGSEDPHGLRRQALGAARIILERSMEIPLKNAVEYSLSMLPEPVLKDLKIPSAACQVLDFIWQRAETLLTEQGFLFDEIRAVKEHFMKTGNIADCAKRVKDLHSARKNPDFEAITLSFKRAKNILRQAGINLKMENPDEAIFEKDEEKRLYRAITEMSVKLKNHVSIRDYEKGLSEILSIKPCLDSFFDNVMVMVEDKRIRENRLRIVNSMVRLFEEVADLSQIQQ